MRIKYAKRMAAVIVMCMIFGAEWKALRYLTVDDISSYTRVAAHEFYEQDNIDILFVGASHCYRGINPWIADEMLGGNTFNAGSSSQCMDASYAIVQEALSNYDVRHVYLELSYSMACSASLEERDNLTSTYIVADYMKPSLHKYMLLLKASDPSHYGNSFLTARRNWRQCFDLPYMVNLVKEKRKSSYVHYEYVSNPGEDYMGKGYVAGYRAIRDGSYYTDDSSDAVGVDRIVPSWYEYVEKTIKYCNDKEVPITLFCTPVSNYRLLCWGDYDAYIEEVRKLAGRYGADFYDFNLCREQYWPDSSEWYKDTHHLNADGADAFTKLLCRVVGQEAAAEKIFYDSVEEKFRHLPGAVYGLNYHDETNEKTGETTRIAGIVANRDEGYQYRVERTIADEDTGVEGEPELVQDYSDNKMIEMPTDQKGTLHIYYRNAQSAEAGEMSVPF